MKPITLLVAEDHAIVREGLIALLKQDSRIQVIGEAKNGRQAVELARKHEPEIVLMDLAMPLLNGFEAMRQILKCQPNTRVLILSAHSDDAYVQKAMSLGASGFLLKQIAAQYLPEAIHKVAKGTKIFSPEIAKRLSHQNQKVREFGKEISSIPKALTCREMEVLQLVAEGKANKETAAELCISIKTVEKHRQSLMEKLDIHETAGLTRYAIFAGVIENPLRDEALGTEYFSG